MKKYKLTVLTCIFICLASASAGAASFSGRWSTSDQVCKSACTKEAPEPDFEVKMQIVLIQKGSIVCGLRDQNNLSGKIAMAGLRGTAIKDRLDIEQGDDVFDETPIFPFKVSEKYVLRLSKNRLLQQMERQGTRITYETYIRQSFSAREQKAYMDDEENRTFFDKCFKRAD